MKKTFTLSLVAATAVSAFAFEAKTSSTINFTEARQAVKVINEVVACDQEATLKLAPAATAASPYKAFYKPYGVMYFGLFTGEQGWGYAYSVPYAAAPVGGAYLQAVYGDKWTNRTTSEDGESYTDEVVDDVVDGKYEISGVFGNDYYMPKIWNGEDFYYYGSDGSRAAKGYSVVYTGEYATDAEDMMTLGNYNINANTKTYTGWANTAAFGSRAFINTNTGDTITSNKLLIEYQVPAGQSFVLDHIEIPALNAKTVAGTAADSLWEDETVTLEASLVEYDETGVLATYTAIISKSDIVDVSGTNMLNIYFTEEDEDGFESGISPVLHHDFQLVIEGFAKPGIHIATYMSYDNSAYKDAEGYSVSEHYTASYYDQLVNGVENKEGAFYGDARCEAVVNLIGCYYTLADYMTGEPYFEGEVPAGAEVSTTESGVSYCVAQYTVNGQAYNDFNLMTPSALDDLEVECEDETFLGYEVDDQYYEQYGAYVFYFIVSPLAEGEQAHTIKGVIKSDLAEMPFTIEVGSDAQNGLNNIAASESKSVIYNMMGQKVENINAKGLYLPNGKKIMK